MERLTLDKAPPVLKQLLENWEFSDDLCREHVSTQRQYNLAIQQVEYHGNRIVGNLVKNPVMSARFYGQTMKKPEKEMQTQIRVEITMQDVSFLKGANEVWALGVTAASDQHLKRRDAIFFCTTPSTIVMPHPERFPYQQTLTMELFAGGFGGWSWAKRHAEVIGAPKTRSVAVEKDAKVAVQHAINHPAHVFLPEVDTPEDLLDKLSGDCMFIQDVADVRWQRSVTTHRHEYWTISSSCQSWSTAGNGAGLGDPRGMTLPQSLAAARIFRPKAILVEQVQGFRKHEDYSHFLALTHWAGYFCWHEDICELSELCPVKRPRYLAIFLRESENWDALPSYIRWGDFPTIYPLNFGSWIPSTPAEFQALKPTETEKAFYMHPDLFPQKRKENISQHRIFEARVPGLTRIQPVTMAMYGQQHHLSLNLLLQKGLHGYFCQEAGEYRWFKPMELILMHLQTDAIVILKPIEQAWRIIGNQIAMPHALLLLLNMWRSLGKLPKDFRMHALFQKLRDIRMQAKQVQILEDDQAWYMAYPPDMHQLQIRLKTFASLLGEGRIQDFEPSGQVFIHAEKGRLDIQVLCETPLVTHAYAMSGPVTVEVPKRSHQVSATVDAVKTSTLEMHDQQQHAHKKPRIELVPTSETSRAQVHLFFIPGEYGVLDVHSSVETSQLCALWHHPIWLQRAPINNTSAEDTEVKGTLLAYPTTLLPEDLEMPKQSKPTEKGIVLLRSHTKVMAYAFDPNTKVIQLPSRFADEPQVCFDEYGEVFEHTFLRTNTMLMSSEVPIPTCQDVQQIVRASMQIQVHSYVPEETDILVVVFKGQPDEVQTVLNMWHEAFAGTWIQQHARNMNLQVLEDQCRLLFVPSRRQFATPTPMLVRFMQIRLAKYLLKAMHDPEGVPTQIKHECKQMIEISISPKQDFEMIFQATRHAFVLTEHGTNMTLIAFGRRVGGKATPEYLMQGKMVPKLTLQLRHSLWGGGPSVGSRQEHHHLLHTELAAMFHEAGHSVQQTPALVDQVLRSQGMPKIHNLLFRQTDKEEAFRKLCQELDIAQPEIRRKATTTKAKFQKLARHDVNAYHQAAQEFALQPGFFKYENGEEAALLPQFSAWTRGVCIMDSQQAEPWLKQGNQQSPDELAIFIPSLSTLPAARPHRYVYAPALDKDGRQALLGGTLLQLGEKQIGVQEEEQAIRTCPTQVCSITMWREEYAPDQWQILVQSPVKYAKQTLGPELNHAVINPWARSYKNGKDTVKPEEARSAQFHCEVHQEHLASILRVSGYNKLHMTPKTADGAPSPNYGVVWLPGTMQELQAQAAMLPGHAGFVKAKKKHGVRFEVSAFDAAWKKLRPGEPVPDMQTYSHVFRLQPLPYGVDANVLRTWAQNAGWTIKPLKNQGPGRWLIASQTEPPSPWLLFNGKAVLIHKLPPKSDKPYKALVIGPRAARHTSRAAGATKPEESQSSNAFRTGDPFFDPWSKMLPKQGDIGQSEVPSAHAATPGPTAQALQVQDQRIANLEMQLQETQKQQQMHQNNVDGKLKDMERNLHEHQSTQKADLESLKQDFKATLREATTRQQDSLQSALMEFKLLFLSQSNKRQRPETEEAEASEHQTRPKLDLEGSEMEDDM